MERLLVDAKEAAEMLSVSERTLWTLTEEAEVPCVRVRGRKLYYPPDLRAWVERQTDPAKRAVWLEREYPGLVVWGDGTFGVGGDEWPA